MLNEATWRVAFFVRKTRAMPGWRVIAAWNKLYCKLVRAMYLDSEDFVMFFLGCGASLKTFQLEVKWSETGMGTLKTRTNLILQTFLLILPVLNEMRYSLLGGKELVTRTGLLLSFKITPSSGSLSKEGCIPRGNWNGNEYFLTEYFHEGLNDWRLKLLTIFIFAPYGKGLHLSDGNTILFSGTSSLDNMWQNLITYPYFLL